MTNYENSFLAARVYLDRETDIIGETVYGIEIPWDDPLVEKLRDYMEKSLPLVNDQEISLEEFEDTFCD